MPSDYTIVEARPGEIVTDFARRILSQAADQGRVVLGSHNEHTLEARPGMTIEAVMKPWNDAQRRSYFDR